MSSRSFKLTVKDGDVKYGFNEKKGTYTSKTIDYVREPEDVGDALLQFLEWANDDVLEHKVTLTVTPKEKKNK